MIEEVLCAPHEVAESFGDPSAAVTLFPEEERGLAAAVPARRREFAAVRVCARAALARLGETAGPIPPGTRGAPVWPGATVGSMTHCPGYRAAVVARSADVRAVGVDAEPNLPLASEQVLDLVTIPQERSWIADLSAARPEVCWDRLVFSAKESVYKAWYPLTGLWLGFEQVRVEVDARARTFTAHVLRSGLSAGGRWPGPFRGSWTVRRGLLLTAVSVPGPAAARPLPWCKSPEPTSSSR
ncbi:4'-phosphopantetheinyl transferase superfamily protein [Streptomyces sp. NBC_00210]|uniref:4'-phosphopantetheinyl transferase family protein n=1 Tax=unclassified Streptomyces TaxID=2593676 RepID=UPI00325524E2